MNSTDFVIIDCTADVHKMSYQWYCEPCECDYGKIMHFVYIPQEWRV